MTVELGAFKGPDILMQCSLGLKAQVCLAHVLLALGAVRAFLRSQRHR